MNLTKFKIVLLQLLLLAGLGSCDSMLQDVVPETFEDFTLYPDEIWSYNGNNPDVPSARLDVLLNDSIKVDVRVTFGSVKHGRLSVMDDGATYYFPNKDFIGSDTLVYTVCSAKTCKSETAVFIIEKPVDQSTCETLMVDEQVETAKNKWVDIRVHANDLLCMSLYKSWSYYQPRLGRWEDITQSGGYKNAAFRYYPPKDYVGEDSFKYRVYLGETEYIEGTTYINIK